MKNFSRTDLACESTPLHYGDYSSADYEIHNLRINSLVGSEIKIKTEIGERLCGKQIGRYVTLFFENVWEYGKKEVDRICKDLSQAFISFIINDQRCKQCNRFLIVGLGNRRITSDSFGPSCVDKMLPTAHLEIADKKYMISLLAPGVTGQTGIETSKIVKGCVNASNAQCLILIDSLASKSIDRLCSSIQISDTGLAPGSGIGNHREEINHSNMGVPVFSIGIPTVVSSATLFYDILNQENVKNMSPRVYKILESHSNFFVSPKDVDIIIESISTVVSTALTLAFKGQK